MYLSSAHIHPFKVDVRFNFDRNGREYDVASLEPADCQEAKATVMLESWWKKGRPFQMGWSLRPSG